MPPAGFEPALPAPEAGFANRPLDSAKPQVRGLRTLSKVNSGRLRKLVSDAQDLRDYLCGVRLTGHGSGRRSQYCKPTMCLEVFLGTGHELLNADDGLIIDDRVPGDIKRRLQGLHVVHIGAAHSGCGFLVDGQNVEENQVDDETRQAHDALMNYVNRLVSKEPVRLVVRWAGAFLKKTNITEVEVGDLNTLDVSVAWDYPQDFRIRPNGSDPRSSS